MKQQSFELSDFRKYRKKTRKEQFLEEIEQIIPWRERCQVIEPYCPGSKGSGRRSIGIERMLHIH